MRPSTVTPREHKKQRERKYYAANRGHIRTLRQVALAAIKEALAIRPRPKLCEVCGRPSTVRNGNPVRLAWDHDHKTGKFRGWLCHACNVALGLSEDNPAILQKLINYLEMNL